MRVAGTTSSIDPRSHGQGAERASKRGVACIEARAQCRSRTSRGVHIAVVKIKRFFSSAVKSCPSCTIASQGLSISSGASPSGEGDALVTFPQMGVIVVPREFSSSLRMVMIAGGIRVRADKHCCNLRTIYTISSVVNRCRSRSEGLPFTSGEGRERGARITC